MGIAIYLIALGIGYLTFSNASLTEKKSLKNLGRVIGIFIMVVALMGTLCKGMKLLRYSMLGGNCPFSQNIGKCGHCGGFSASEKSCCDESEKLTEGKQCPFKDAKAE